jgi:hypothetical protein
MLSCAVHRVSAWRSPPPYWNSAYLADATAYLRADRKLLSPELLALTSPSRWEHI